MTVSSVGPKQLHDALTHVRDALVDAAGSDGKASDDEVARALDKLPEAERRAADVFVASLKAKEGSAVTAVDVDHAIAELRRGLPGVDDKVEIPLASPEAQRLGEGFLQLARRLAGEPGAVLPPLAKEELLHLEGDALLLALRERCSAHLALRYEVAYTSMFGVVDNQGGLIQCVYTKREAPADAAHANRINTEHTLPRSRGAKELPAKSDLHHLFPTDAVANEKRSSFPFGHVVGAVWQEGGSKLGVDERGATVFEPPDEHKGNVARALFYMAAIYGVTLPDDEERVLRAWHGRDPIDEAERRRNDAVSSLQGNRNPFVDDGSLVDRVRDF